MNSHAAANGRSALPTHQPQRLISVSLDANDLSYAAFLAHARSHALPRFFWQDAAVEPNHEPVTLAAMGIAANLTAWGYGRFKNIHQQAQTLYATAHLEAHTHRHSLPRLFGGFSFRDDFAPDNTWSIYAPAQFILPHIQLARSPAGSWLTLNALVPPDEDPTTLIPELQDALRAQLDHLLTFEEDGTQIAVSQPNIRYPMPYVMWENNINRAVQDMHSTPLNKVVLARVCEIKFDHTINIDQTLGNLLQTYPDCYVFLFEPRPGHAFLGATPELLARVEGTMLRTMGLAGTAKRGTTDAETERYAQQLLNSRKDQHEHALVVDSLRRKLAPLSAALTIPDTPVVLRLNSIQHLFTPISATLRQGEGILPIVDRLHPTPALGGSPRDLAIAFIQQAEPVPRGWYAAPIGTILPNLDGAFGVAIRSAAVENRRAWLYAGAGIVQDSEPEKEWDETELKFTPMKRALGLTQRAGSAVL